LAALLTIVTLATFTPKQISIIADGPRDVLSVEIFSTAAQLYENRIEKAYSR